MILRFPCGGIGRFNGLFDGGPLPPAIPLWTDYSTFAEHGVSTIVE
jgi:hypothetical protein